MRRRRDRFDGLLGQLVGKDQLDLQLGQNVDLILAPAIELRVAALSPESTLLADRHAAQADRCKRVLYLVQFEWFDIGFDLLHRLLQSW
tara:strand:+ start:998 stop:1264 length:267 start_codon:yes stop_codon:yes gene_type:complete